MENNSKIGSNGGNLPEFCGETDTNLNQVLVSHPAGAHNFLSLWKVGASLLWRAVCGAQVSLPRWKSPPLESGRTGLKQSAKHVSTGEAAFQRVEALKSTIVLGKPPFAEDGTANLYFVYEMGRDDELQQFCPSPRKSRGFGRR